MEEKKFKTPSYCLKAQKAYYQRIMADPEKKKECYEKQKKRLKDLYDPTLHPQEEIDERKRRKKEYQHQLYLKKKLEKLNTTYI